VLTFVSGQWHWRKLKARYCQRITGETIVLRAQGGICLEGTPAHPVFVIRDGLGAWVRLADVTKNDFVVSPKQTPAGKTVRAPRTEVIDLLTWQLTEGWENSSKSTTMITQQEIAVLKRLLRCFRKVLPNDPSGYIRRPKRKHAAYLEISSLAYRRLLEGVGYVWGHKSAKKALPPSFLQWPVKALTRALRNIFDAEGSVSNSIEITLASRKLIIQIQYALLRLGIHASFHLKTGLATNGKRIKRPYYRLHIMGVDAATFHKKIGFGTKYKRTALAKIARKVRNPNNGVPIAWLYTALRPFGIGNKQLGITRNRERTLSPHSVQTVLRQLHWLCSTAARTYYTVQVTKLGGAAGRWAKRTLAGIIAGEAALLESTRRLTALIDTPLQYYGVTELHRGETAGLVYDLEVDSGIYDYKNYVGGVGGIVLHNTLSSLAVADALGLQADVVTPAALQENYRKEMKTHTKHAPKMNLQTLEGVARNKGQQLKNPLLIVDEAHRIRNEGKARTGLKQSPAEKRLALTGSLVYNDPSDVAGPLNFAAGRTILPEDPSLFAAKYLREEPKSRSIWDRIKGTPASYTTRLNPRTQGHLQAALDKYVDYHPGSTENFPTRQDQTIRVPMSHDQMGVYAKVIQDMPPGLQRKMLMNLPPSKTEAQQLNAFMAGARQVSNTTQGFDTKLQRAHSPKIDRAVNELQKILDKNPRAKAIVYSHYLDSGLNPYKEQLEKRKIPYGMFTGNMPRKQREQMVRDYNDDKLKALLLSSAGGEGLDLRGTSAVQLLEPHFNRAKLDQVIGRGIRYKSHAHLPEDQRNVLVQRFLATRSPYGALERLNLKKPGYASDEYLDEMGARKERLNNQVKALLREYEP